MTAPRLRPLLVNRYERVTDRLLTAAADENGDRLAVKVGLADVLEVDPTSYADKEFALKAHLDFVMVSQATSRARFAVEFDGSQHFTDPKTRARDRRKDRLCEAAGLPLLRITSDYLQRRSKWVVLNYVIDAFYLSEAFYEAQVSGYIPGDEPFFPTSVLTTNDRGQIMFSALDAESRLRLFIHHENQRLPVYAPDEFVTRDPTTGAVHAVAFMAVAPNRYLIAQVRVRDFRFQGITPSEVAEQLAVAEIGYLADRWVEGEPVGQDQRQLVRVMQAVQGRIDQGGFLRCGTSTGTLEAGGPLDTMIRVSFGPTRAES